ncbi:hypothetical protein LJR098_003508 [Rhizobium sp. LjRoot98]|uniref:hypothetical protein n=1 Tax=Rhizobium sp. LjRoot98 TaxID=3342345 RepID=UPI003ED02896
MSETFSSRWSAYRPSKKVWLWSTIGASLLTMAIGFAGAGWQTGGRASVMAEMAARQARNDVAAGICVERFISAEGAAKNLETLRNTANWDRSKFIEDGGWSTIKGAEDLGPSAAAYCVKELIRMKELPVTIASDT